MKWIFVLLFIPSFSQAQFDCTAQVFEALPNGKARQEVVQMTPEYESEHRIVLSAELDGRAYTFNGPKKSGPYLVSITEAPDYTKGSLTTSDFSPEGRLQISVVNGQLVHKLECYRTQPKPASAPPLKN